MRRFFILSLVVVGSLWVVSRLVFAYPLDTEFKTKLEGQPLLREQMGKMILSVADMDIMVNREQIVDFEILQEDAARILEAVETIKKIDTTGIFKKHIKNLEMPTRKMLDLAKQKNVKATLYPDKIFEACFKCHSVHRDN
jgi:hypothetical protein